MIKYLVMSASIASVISGCTTDSGGFTSTVVTPQGNVECVHYLANVAIFDHAVSKPDSMSNSTARIFCLRKGTGTYDHPTNVIPEPTVIFHPTGVVGESSVVVSE